MNKIKKILLLIIFFSAIALTVALLIYSLECLSWEAPFPVRIACGAHHDQN
jgi:hypothetical protein